MPHDKNGKELKSGDIVTMKFKVVEVYKGEEACNLNLESVEKMYPYEYGSQAMVNTKQVELVTADTGGDFIR